MNLYTILLVVALIATSVTPAKAATPRPTPAPPTTNSCTVGNTSSGQWVTQNSGTAGTITIHVNGTATFTIPRLGQPYKATSDKKARVGGYDANGKVC